MRTTATDQRRCSIAYGCIPESELTGFVEKPYESSWDRHADDSS
jgi:hypothetical protein